LLKKIVIVTTVPDTLELILNTQPAYLANFYAVTLISSDGRGRLKKLGLKENVETVSIEMARGINPLADVKSIFAMYRKLRKLRPDIVHSYTPKAGMVCAFAGFLARVPIRVHTFTGLIFPSCVGMKRWMLQTIDRLICCLNTHVVPEGEGVKTDLATICSKPLTVIGHGNIAGVDLDLFNWEDSLVLKAAEQLKRQFNLLERRVFCYVGRLNRDKGLKELCEAFLQCRDKNAALLIVGALDEENPIESQTLSLLTETAGIYWLGFQSDVRVALAAAEVFILPSYREGFPNVLLQAGAMAKPALVTDVSGSNEIVLHNCNGWIVPPRDAAALARQMLQIIEITDAQLVQKGQNALRIVSERFERRQYQARLLEYYQGILS
jgi:glycosyltransferase involved in cell wall biosynthesis